MAQPLQKIGIYKNVQIYYEPFMENYFIEGEAAPFLTLQDVYDWVDIMLDIPPYKGVSGIPIDRGFFNVFPLHDNVTKQ